MIHKLKHALDKHFPIKITLYEWDGDNLFIGSDNWSFNTISAWRILKDGYMLAGCHDPDVEPILKEAVCQEIIGIECLKSNPSFDLEFIMEGNYKLQVFCTTYYEPWIFRIDGQSTFVASPSDRNLQI